MIVKVEIGMASLADIAEKACKVYRRELAEVEFLNDIQCIFDSLADVMRLWEAAYNNFDCDDELILTLERREVRPDKLIEAVGDFQSTRLVKISGDGGPCKENDDE